MDVSDVRVNNHRFDATTKSLISPDGDIIRLRAKSYKALEFLVQHANTVVTREALTDAIWRDIVGEFNS